MAHLYKQLHQHAKFKFNRWSCFWGSVWTKSVMTMLMTKMTKQPSMLLPAQMLVKQKCCNPELLTFFNYHEFMVALQKVFIKFRYIYIFNCNKNSQSPRPNTIKTVLT